MEDAPRSKKVRGARDGGAVEAGKGEGGKKKGGRAEVVAGGGQVGRDGEVFWEVCVCVCVCVCD